MTKRKTKEKPQDKAPVKVREMTPAEQARYDAYKARKQAWPGALKFENLGKPGGELQVGFCAAEPHSVMMSARTAATGMIDQSAVSALLLQSVGSFPLGKDPVSQMNGILAMMTEFAPCDGLEGMLAAQMVASHSAALRCMNIAHATGQTFEGRKLNLTFADRFMRTFTAQVEALAKYRGKGQQKVTVEHVHVHQGGQAIVGNVTTGGGGHGTGNDGTTSSQQAIEAAGESITLRSANGAEVWGALQGDGEAVPATGDAERAL